MLLSTFLWRPLHDYNVKPPIATFYGGRGHTTTNFPFSIWTWIKPLRIQLQEKSPTFDELSGSRRDIIWKDENSFFLVMCSLPSSSLLKVPIFTGWHQNKEVNESKQPFSLGGLYVYGLSFLPKCEFASLFLLLRCWKLLNENIDIVTLLSQVHGMQ